MKTSPILLTLALASASLLTGTGCPKKPEPKIAQAALAPTAAREENTSVALAEPSTPEVSVIQTPQTVAADPLQEMSAALEAATPDRHEGLSTIQQRMDRFIDSQISAWKAGGNNVSLADDEKLDNATEDFAEKLRMLTLSAPEVWETAKHNTELALRNVRSAYSVIVNKPLPASS